MEMGGRPWSNAYIPSSVLSCTASVVVRFLTRFSLVPVVSSCFLYYYFLSKGVVSGFTASTLKQEFFCQLDCSIIPSTVEKSLSRTQWKCGETCPVVRSITRATCFDWWGDLPKYTPTLSWALRLRKGLFCCNSSCRTYDGHPKCANVLVFLWILVPV